MQFKVNKNRITRLDEELLTTENVNSVECNFSFSKEYDGLGLFAVFYRNEEENRLVPITDGKCVVPWEMLERAGLLYVGVYGVKNTTDSVEKRMTSNAVSCMVLKSLNSSVSANAAPSPDLWEQYRAEILGYHDGAKLYAAQAETCATEAEGSAVTAVRSAGQANGSALQADESAMQAENAAGQALHYRNQAEEIKNSVRIEYDLQPTRIGIKQGNETSFTYTDDLTGPRGEKGDKGDRGDGGIPILVPDITQLGDEWVFSIDSDELKGEIGELFVMVVPSNPPVSSIIINGKAFFCASTEWLADAAYLMLVASDWTIRVVGYETSSSDVSAHNASNSAHNDIRLLIQGLTTRLNALANSTDEDLDQMAEIVAYIKSNKGLIDSITTSKVSVADIVNDLTTNTANKPLSAAQGVALKSLIDGIIVPTKVSQLINDAGYLIQHQSLADYAKKAEIPTKTSQLTNDSKFLTSVPNEYVTDTELTAKGYAVKSSAESWTFELEDGTTVTKKVVLA